MVCEEELEGGVDAAGAVGGCGVSADGTLGLLEVGFGLVDLALGGLHLGVDLGEVVLRILEATVGSGRLHLQISQIRLDLGDLL